MTTYDEASERLDEIVQVAQGFVSRQLYVALGESPEAWRGAGVVAQIVQAAMQGCMTACVEDTDTEHEALLLAGMAGITGIVLAVHASPAFQALENRRDA